MLRPARLRDVAITGRSRGDDDGAAPSFVAGAARLGSVKRVDSPMVVEPTAGIWEPAGRRTVI